MVNKNKNKKNFQVCTYSEKNVRSFLFSERQPTPTQSVIPLFPAGLKALAINYTRENFQLTCKTGVCNGWLIFNYPNIPLKIAFLRKKCKIFQAIYIPKPGAEIWTCTALDCKLINILLNNKMKQK